MWRKSLQWERAWPNCLKKICLWVIRWSGSLVLLGFITKKLTVGTFVRNWGWYQSLRHSVVDSWMLDMKTGHLFKRCVVIHTNHVLHINGLDTLWTFLHWRAIVMFLEQRLWKTPYIYIYFSSTSFAVHLFFCSAWCSGNKNTFRTLWTHRLSNVDLTIGSGP